MTVKLQGGLGNQMFQFAYGISKYGKDALFDLSSFEHDTLRHYELNAYDLPIQFRNDPDAENGYWQDERFFDKELVFNLFRKPSGYPNDACLKMARRIQDAKDSCFIGVRRADYLWPERIHYHGVMPMEYYHAALSRIPPSKVFVFSDDLVWASENFSDIGEGVDVNGPNEKHWDIWLMSLCEHAILANSTFHWWGAWLGPDRNGGTIIAPNKWFANEQVNSECTIVPERWMRI